MSNVQIFIGTHLFDKLTQQSYLFGYRNKFQTFSQCPRHSTCACSEYMY